MHRAHNRANFKTAVVEFGPGTGVFTERILAKIPAQGMFFALELNEEFIQATRQRCPTAEVIHDSATNARQHLQAHDLNHCDCIISGSRTVRSA